MYEPFRDPTLTPRERVDDLLRRMSLREKIGQLNQRLLGWRAWRRDGEGISLTSELDDELARWGGLGALYGMLRADAWSGRDWETGADPARSADVAAAIQQRVRAASRWGIPALFVEEAPHGHQALGSQLLPVNLAAAATWRPELLEEAAAHVGAELAARGAHLALVSGLDILRDPRWGRAEETFGEDPLLAAHFTRALVRGLQRQAGIGAVLKHFAGQGAGIGGRNSSGAPLGPRELAEIHFPAARAGIDEGAVGVMAAYNDIDGVPCVADRTLLTDTLRDDWGFEGIVMADMFAVDRLMRATTDAAHAGAVALRAGVDLSMCDLSFTELELAVERGLLTEADVDVACARVLELKVRLGLLDGDPPRVAFPSPTPDIAEAIASASLVLLRDERGVLPLPREARVAIVGPNADDVEALLGDYVPPLPPGVASSIREAIGRIGGIDPPFEAGCALTEPIDGGLERAAAVARESDAVVLVLGSSSGRSYDDDFQANGAAALGGRPPGATTGEGFDVAEVRLPRAQRDLVEAVTGAGVPTVAVIVSGRPLGVEEVLDRCDATIYAWYPGPQGGQAVAGALFSQRDWTGRLPVSLPRSSGSLPVTYNERLETTLRYVDGDAAAVVSFGAGARDDRIRLSDPRGPLRVAWRELPGTVVSVRVRNDGARAADVLVQLYARARVPGILPRRAVLVGFAHERIEPGSTRRAEMTIDRDARTGFEEGASGLLDLWFSTTGAGEPVDAITIEVC
ncbi:glycoside hydrolase family 3 N-terminal domain-containing protein [Microbacterium immunditiarum]|uniref:Beta-glucosidase n=1 Tax=Microbacterium immunditiarum TaxID=337480 RepID=A0A7Y9KKQ9_9MICO|nr:glycoside hydrolase family 3 N-terminal domain-containing protein [Microbacterium immunditiarum]NYE19014.1 beta-glucosidase [Microbacterium immunditiarum]